MEEIKEFSSEVCREIGYYVYRLVDPRNGQTFYVGKGKNNRVFAHAKCALKNYTDVDYNPEEDDDESLKYRTIREIKDAGLEVIYIIERYHLSERDAFLIESVLIDTYSIKRELTNKIKGYESTESVNALTLETLFNISEYDDSPNNPQYVIIKVKDYWLNQRENRYECTRSSWKVDINKIRKYQYVLSVTYGVVKAVYKVTEWHKTEWGRCEFTGVEAEPKIEKLFIGKKIPAKYRQRGNANPVLYCKAN